VKTKKIIRTLSVTTVLTATSWLQANDTLVIKGSDTLGAKMVPQIAEAFKAKLKKQGKSVSFEIAAEGSSTGVASVIDGTSDIGMSSRDPKAKEIAKAKANGIDMKTITVAKDAIAVIVNELSPLNNMTLEQVEMIFSGDVSDWSAISAITGEISAYTRNTSSGTYAVFQKMAMNSRDYGSDTQKMAGNEQIAAEVANNKHAIGYVGLAYIKTPGVKVLKINGIAPISGAYPLARPLYYLVNGNKKLSPLAQDFVDFSLGKQGQAIVKRVDFLPL
jgi:phosphate transport system substrate-binding protein